MKVKRSKIKGIHLTLDDEDVEKAKKLVKYYGYASITALVRVLINREYHRMLDEISKKISALKELGVIEDAM